MNSINYFRNGLSKSIEEIHDLYRHSPPAYDIAIGILRPCLATICLFKSVAIIDRLIGIEALLINVTGKSEVVARQLMSTTAAIIAVAGTLFFPYSEITNLIHQSKLNKITEDQSKNDVVLICGAKSDFNGAANKLSAQGFEIIKKLSKTHSIISKKVGTIEEINNAIDQIHRQGRKIKVLWLKAHGDPDAICLGKEMIVGNDPAWDVTSYLSRRVCVDKIHFEKLDPQSDIVLSSCSVGGKSGIVDGLNIAEWFQLHAGPKTRVFAPKTYLPYCGTNRIVGSDGSVNYEFKGLLGGDITSDISYTKIIEKLNKEQTPLNNCSGSR